MNKGFLACILLSVMFTTTAFSDDHYYDEEEMAYELDSINHEMFLGCVATRSQCQTLATQQGLPVLKVVTDRARCPQRPKTKACIVQH